MDNYYHILGVSSTASAAELEAAMDALYQENQQKARLTHNRDVADEANRMLRLLEEQIRPTLTDPARRSAYDARIGLGGVQGGLADPGENLRGFGPIVPPPKPGSPKPPGKSAETSISSLWTCPRPDCRADNPPHTRHCFKCGTELVRQCPECDAMTSLVATQMCGTCGYDYEVAVQRRTLKARMNEAQNEIRVLEGQIYNAKAKKVEGCGRNLIVFVGIFGIVWGMLGFRDSFWGWLIGIICFGSLVLWYRKVESEKEREVHNLNQLLEAKNHELIASIQEYQRLALHRTGD